MRNLLPLFLIFFGSYGCSDCGPQKELSASIYINKGKEHVIPLTKVYALGALDQQIFQKQVEDFNTGNPFPSFNFPISLHADSTTYVFEFEIRTDTLTLFYKRDFYYKKNCGFVTDTQSPGTWRTSKSTFSEVNVSYQSYLTRDITLTGSKGGEGISVNISL